MVHPDTSVIVCCRVDDPDPACVTEPDHVVASCAMCGHVVRVGPASLEVILETGAQPWCIQCVAAQPEGSMILVRPRP